MNDASAALRLLRQHPRGNDLELALQNAAFEFVLLLHRQRQEIDSQHFDHTLKTFTQAFSQAKELAPEIEQKLPDSPKQAAISIVEARVLHQ